MRRIVTIQDLSCVGKCSLTVALPILSCMGLETIALPTAVLSNHTAFEEFSFCDLTKELPIIKEKWDTNRFSFDTLYTGYLGSFEQIEFVLQILPDIKKNQGNIIVDPVMADHGSFYTGFDKQFASKMIELSSKADCILPNITEACFLLDKPYKENFSKEELEIIMMTLAKKGSKKVILTGISLNKDEIGVYAYDSEENKFYYYANERLEASFHGTGDIFASAFSGAITLGKTLSQSIKIAVDFTLECMKKTKEDANHRWYGVNFEEALPTLFGMLENK